MKNNLKIIAFAKCAQVVKILIFDITLKIAEKPKILIFLILNGHEKVEIKINDYILNNSYKLICVVVNNKKPIRNLFDYMINLCSCRYKNKYQILYGSSEKMLELDINDKILRKNLKNLHPYALFYKKVKKEIEEFNDLKDEDLKSDDILISYAEQNNKKNL